LKEEEEEEEKKKEKEEAAEMLECHIHVWQRFDLFGSLCICSHFEGTFSTSWS
jgi:hypothetical protein